MRNYIFYFKEPKVVSDKNLGILVRQMALHCTLAAQIQKTLDSGRDPYASNWLERLRQIKRIKEKIKSEANVSGSSSSLTGQQQKSGLHDFTQLVLRSAKDE